MLGSDFTVEGYEDDVRSILEMATTTTTTTTTTTSTAGVGQCSPSSSSRRVNDTDDLSHHVTAEDRVGHAQRAIGALIPRYQLLPQPLQHRDLIHFLSSHIDRYIYTYPYTRIHKYKHTYKHT